jgi:hypothetical protein
MAVGIRLKLPGATAEQDDQLNAAIDPDGNPPDGVHRTFTSSPCTSTSPASKRPPSGNTMDARSTIHTRLGTRQLPW